MELKEDRRNKEEAESSTKKEVRLEKRQKKSQDDSYQKRNIKFNEFG